MTFLTPSPRTQRPSPTLEGLSCARSTWAQFGSSFDFHEPIGATPVPRDPFTRRAGATPIVHAVPFLGTASEDLWSADLEFPARIHAGFFPGRTGRGILTGPKTKARPSSCAIFPNGGVNVPPFGGIA